MTAKVKDYSLALRKAVIVRLRATAALTALVPAARIFPERVPGENETWPFIRYGSTILSPQRFDGYEGGTHEITIHAFSDSHKTDEIYGIRREIIAALDEADLTIEDDARATNFIHTLSNLIPDGAEADAYHDIHNFTVSVQEKL